MKSLAQQAPSPVEVSRAKGDGTWTSPGYRSATTRARWAQLFFGLVALASLMEVALLSQEMNFIKSAHASDYVQSPGWESYLKNSSDIGNFYRAAALGLAVAFIAWLSRTVDNIPPLGGGTSHYSPRWAIGWWFVPVAFLVMPYTIVCDAWQRLATSGRRTNGALVGAWWLSFVGSTVLSRYAAESADDASIGTLYTIGLAGGALAIVAAICGLLVVREIQARSDERARAVGIATPRSFWPAWIPAHASVVHKPGLRAWGRILSELWRPPRRALALLRLPWRELRRAVCLRIARARRRAV